MFSINLSDHAMVDITRRKFPTSKDKTSFKGRSYKNYDTNILKEHLRSHDWETFYKTDDPNILWNEIDNIILEMLNNMCPFKEFRVKVMKEPWINNDILELIKEKKDRLLDRAKKTKKNRRH